MDASDLGLVFTSTTGLELALPGQAGDRRRRDPLPGQGLHPRRLEPGFRRGVAALDDPGPTAPNRDLARRYAHLFFFEAPVASPGVEEHVLGLVRLTVDDLAELAPGADPDVDRICDLILAADDAAASSAA